MNPAEKTSVLLAALSERYEALRVIRARVQEVCLWSMGVLFGASGWITTSHQQFSWETKLAFLAVLVAAMVVVRCIYLRDLASGFRTQQKVAAKVEEALGFYKPNFFGVADPIYPKEWLHAGGAKGKGKFFAANFALLYVAGLVLALSVVFSGILF
jgi:uncharacterized membrane protein YsdA (DUF1294 family)